MKDTEKYKALFTPVRIANVEIRNRIAMAPMSLETIEAENPDEIIVATGSKPFIPPIEGLETSNWAHCIEALNCDKPLGQHASILVIAVGMRPEHKLFVDADKKFPNVRRIGDCLQPRNIQGAIWDAYEVMRRL